jgi:hypothetical protein
LLNIYNFLSTDLSNSLVELTTSVFYMSFLEVSFNETTKLRWQSYRNNQYVERLSQFPDLKYEEGKEKHATCITLLNILCMYPCYRHFITFMRLVLDCMH